MRSMRACSVEFSSSGSRIKGYFFPGSIKPIIATVIFLQGFPGVEGDELICERLAQGCVNVLTFNYRGTFRSEGHFSFPNAIADVGAALRFVKESQTVDTYHIDPNKIILGGWSFGSGIVPVGAAQHPDIKKIFLISGRDFCKEALKIKQDPEYAKKVTANLETIRSPKGPVLFRDDLLTDLIDNRAIFDIDYLSPLLKDRDILLISGWDDSVTAIEDNILPFYRSLIKNCANKVKIEAIQDDHEFLHSRDRLVEIIMDWLNKE
jgi:pimeloyl-ACP methyl ester carboxylesterase